MGSFGRNESLLDLAVRQGGTMVIILAALGMECVGRDKAGLWREGRERRRDKKRKEKQRRRNKQSGKDKRRILPQMIVAARIRTWGNDRY